MLQASNVLLWIPAFRLPAPRSRLREAEAAEPVIGRRFAPTRGLRQSKVGGLKPAEARAASEGRVAGMSG
jgi:hypothetical protein